MSLEQALAFGISELGMRPSKILDSSGRPHIVVTEGDAPTAYNKLVGMGRKVLGLPEKSENRKEKLLTLEEAALAVNHVVDPNTNSNDPFNVNVDSLLFDSLGRRITNVNGDYMLADGTHAVDSGFLKPLKEDFEEGPVKVEERYSSMDFGSFALRFMKGFGVAAATAGLALGLANAVDNYSHHGQFSFSSPDVGASPIGNHFFGAGHEFAGDSKSVTLNGYYLVPVRKIDFFDARGKPKPAQDYNLPTLFRDAQELYRHMLKAQRNGGIIRFLAPEERTAQNLDFSKKISDGKLDSVEMQPYFTENSAPFIRPAVMEIRYGSKGAQKIFEQPLVFFNAAEFDFDSIDYKIPDSGLTNFEEGFVVNPGYLTLREGGDIRALTESLFNEYNKFLTELTKNLPSVVARGEDEKEKITYEVNPHYESFDFSKGPIKLLEQGLYLAESGNGFGMNILRFSASGIMGEIFEDNEFTQKELEKLVSVSIDQGQYKFVIKGMLRDDSDEVYANINLDVREIPGYDVIVAQIREEGGDPTREPTQQKQLNPFDYGTWRFRDSFKLDLEYDNLLSNLDNYTSDKGDIGGVDPLNLVFSSQDKVLDEILGKGGSVSPAEIKRLVGRYIDEGKTKYQMAIELTSQNKKVTVPVDITQIIPDFEKVVDNVKEERQKNKGDQKEQLSDQQGAEVDSRPGYDQRMEAGWYVEKTKRGESKYYCLEIQGGLEKFLEEFNPNIVLGALYYKDNERPATHNNVIGTNQAHQVKDYDFKALDLYNSQDEDGVQYFGFNERSAWVALAEKADNNIDLINVERDDGIEAQVKDKKVARNQYWIDFKDQELVAISRKDAYKIIKHLFDGKYDGATVFEKREGAWVDGPDKEKFERYHPQFYLQSSKTSDPFKDPADGGNLRTDNQTNVYGVKDSEDFSILGTFRKRIVEFFTEK